MAEWRDKIKTTVDTTIINVPSVEATFISKEPFKLIIYILNDGFEARNENRNN